MNLELGSFLFLRYLMFNCLTLLLNKGFFVVGSLLCSQRFFSGYSGFPFSPKTNISKSQFDQESVLPPPATRMCYLLIFIYFIIILKVNLLKLDNTRTSTLSNVMLGYSVLLLTLSVLLLPNHTL